MEKYINRKTIYANGHMYETVDYFVCCGEVVPEGTMVCINCLSVNGREDTSEMELGSKGKG